MDTQIDQHTEAREARMTDVKLRLMTIKIGSCDKR